MVDVLPETGVCYQPLFVVGTPCPLLRLPDGSIEPAMIVGFHRPGPLTIEIDRLIYDYTGWLIQDYTPPPFEYAGEIGYRRWSPVEWPPCQSDACALRAPPPLHPAYSVPYPEEVARDFIEVEPLSDDGVCISHALPDDREFACHEVRLPGGEVIALDIGPHERFPIGSMLRFQRITYAAPHPLFDHDRFDFYARAPW